MGANPEPTKTPTPPRAATVSGSSINAALANSSIFFIEHLCHGYLQFYCRTVMCCYVYGYTVATLAVPRQRWWFSAIIPAGPSTRLVARRARMLWPLPEEGSGPRSFPPGG